MTRYRFSICDVFSSQRFGGNPLAVLPDARGLRDEQMQQIAREFGFSETTFVLPPEAGGSRRVRIFTPTTELPFAGHPNVGTAWVLARAGEFGALGETIRVVFEEGAGPVPISIFVRDGAPARCELTAPEPLSLGQAVDPERLAAAVGLEPDAIETGSHPPQVASVGLPFLIAELRDLDALARARGVPEELERLRADGIPPLPHVYTRSEGDFDFRARMFAPLDLIPEDPATGSANCALAGLRARLSETPDGELRYAIAQGVEMGRPSALFASVRKRAGRVEEVRIAGDCAFVAEGEIEAG